MIRMKQNESQYAIPLRFRKMENLHIVFWLFKDLSWCLEWRNLGIIMILPTFIISLVITWRTRHMVAELCHNAAISIWILANSYWMISEFLHFNEIPLFGIYTYKHLAVFPFIIGLAFVGYYYLIYQRGHRSRSVVMNDEGLLEETNDVVVTTK
jgi:hypothetical protein